MPKRTLDARYLNKSEYQLSFPDVEAFNNFVEQHFEDPEIRFETYDGVSLVIPAEDLPDVLRYYNLIVTRSCQSAEMLVVAYYSKRACLIKFTGREQFERFIDRTHNDPEIKYNTRDGMSATISPADIPDLLKHYNLLLYLVAV